MANEDAASEVQECERRDAECHGSMTVICEYHFEARLNQEARTFEGVGRKKERASVVAYLSKRASAEFLAKREDTARLLRDLADSIRGGVADTE